jgi:hypothetical protein
VIKNNPEVVFYNLKKESGIFTFQSEHFCAGPGNMSDNEGNSDTGVFSCDDSV